MKKYLILHIACLMSIMAWAQERNEQKHWRTYFAYNSVQVIAMDAQEEVYAVANGKLFSIHPTSEKLTLYNNFSGMHGTDIAQIAYDQARKQMLIMYTDGKMDIWHDNKQMQYISDLYNKQMTASKKCNNITIAGNMAYLSMDFGILTFDLEQYELVDAFYIGAEASEVSVSDVMIQGDSIYAKTRDSVYVAHMQDNIVDYRYWTSRAAASVVFDSKKGREYTSSNGDIWKVAGAKGVERRMVTKEVVYYLPDGPEVNTPYSLTWSGGRLWMVQGGRWVNENRTPGHIMIYDNGKWKNITNSALQAANNKIAVLDLTGVAVDKDDATHFWVSSYGTGLYEFKNDSLVQRYTAKNSIIGSAASSIDRYTRVENPVYDQEGVLWVNVAGGVDTTLVAFLPDGSQRGVNFNTGVNERYVLNTPGGLLIDHINPNRKWAISSRAEPGVVLLDDGGTRYDGKDDQCVVRKEFLDQDGQIIAPEFFYGIGQGPDGSVWIASSSGPIIIPRDTISSQEIDMLQTNTCKRLRIEMADGSYLLENDRINAFAWDSDGKLWIGSQAGGVFVLNADYSEIVACYTSSNSVMPSNTVLSLAWDEDKEQMFIGTSGGLVSYTDNPDIYSSLDYNEQEEADYNYGSMFRWRAHNAFTYVEEVVLLGNKVYGLSAGSLFAVDRETRVVSNITKLDGLSASGINHITKNESLNRMLITYQNGEIDIVDAEGEIHPIMDLYLKQMNGSKVVNEVSMYKEKAYLAMSWGILVVNMQKAEIEDTYYIGDKSSEVNVQYICTVGEQVYAMTDSALYCANMRDNLVDYAYWKTVHMPTGKVVSGMCEYCGMLFMVVDGKLWKLQKDNWVQISMRKLRGLHKTGDHLWLLPEKNGIGKLPKTGAIEWFAENMVCYCIAEDGNHYWIGSESAGLVKYNITNKTGESYYPEGPSNNYSYWIRFVGDRLYMLPGGRWADQFKRKGDIMIFENETWRNIKNADLLKMTGGHKVLDLMNVAQDPRDARHYWVSSYGTGLYEFYDDKLQQIYLPNNSNLTSATEINPTGYTRTDGAMYDDQGNLWVLNLGGGGTKNIHVISPDGQWHSFNITHNRTNLEMHTAGEILVDKRNPAWKWIPLLRYNTGLVLLDDNGTPTQPSDDKTIYRIDWRDQNGNIIAPTTIHALAQDYNNVLWIGTGSGILAIPPSVDFMKSNSCIRVIIPRNDGTNLGDYLLDNEQVNAIKVDGANRLWVGTANSGIFLLKPVSENVADPSYYVETVAHFTTKNSILPSNEIMSIDINESTGEVFIATGGGLVSYMSDATQGHKDYSEIYAYPNPVRPEYRGYITFKGLMGKTELRIVDAGGNLVKMIHSEGGTATWDGKNTRGERVSSGVYTAICNTSDGEHSGTVKVLILH